MYKNHTHENIGCESNDFYHSDAEILLFLRSHIQQRLLGRVRQEESHKTSSNEQGGHSEDGNGTGCLNKVAENKVAQDRPEPGGHQRDRHGGRPQVGREKLNSKAVQRVETHCGNRAKDTADHEVHGGAVDKVDEEGRAATE